MKILGIKQWIFHEVALLVHYFQVELDFGMLVFVTGGGGKPEDPGKNPRSKDENQQQLKSHVKPGPGMEPRSQRMEGKRFYLCASPAPNKRPK